MATLLQIVDDAVDEIGNIARPSVVYASTDRTVQRMLALSNREGRDLMRSNPWTVLQRIHTFTTVASQSEYDLPADFDRLISGTEWNRSAYQRIGGPLTPQQWQVIKSGLIGTGSIGKRYRIYRSATSATRKFQVDPTPTSDDEGETLAFEYVSAYWCASSGGTAQAAWAADDDTSLLDDDLMRLGLIVRFKRSIGLDFASEADEYAQILMRAKSQDRPARTLSMVPRPDLRLISPLNLPETGLGS